MVEPVSKIVNCALSIISELDSCVDAVVLSLILWVVNRQCTKVSSTPKLLLTARVRHEEACKWAGKVWHGIHASRPVPHKSAQKIQRMVASQLCLWPPAQPITRILLHDDHQQQKTVKIKNIKKSTVQNGRGNIGG